MKQTIQDSKKTFPVMPPGKKTDYTLRKKNPKEEITELQRLADNSTVVRDSRGMQEMADASPRTQQQTGLKKSEDKSHSPDSFLRQLGSGEPLETSKKSQMQSLFGEDFSEVRIHTDPRADQLSGDLNARAFTVGKDIAFARGEYAPGTPVGDALLAHELAHTIQQKQSLVMEQDKPVLVDNTGPLEKEAEKSSLGVIKSIWGKAGKFVKGIHPRLKTGLRLSKCSKTPGRSELSEMEPHLTSTVTFYVRPLNNLNKLKKSLQTFNIHVSDDYEEVLVADPHNNNQKTYFYTFTASITDWTPEWIQSVKGFESVFTNGNNLYISEFNETLIDKLSSLETEYHSQFPGMFSLTQGTRMEKIKEGTCIGVLNQSLVNLYGSFTLQRGELADQAFETIEKLKEMNRVMESQNFEASIISGKESNVIEHNLDHANETIEFARTSPGQWMKNLIERLTSNNNQNGIYVFPGSIANGYHSMSILVLKYDGKIYPYWKDQHGYDDTKTFEWIDYKIKRYLMDRYTYLRKNQTEDEALDNARGDMKKNLFAILKP